MSCKYCRDGHKEEFNFKIQAGTYMLKDLSNRADKAIIISDDNGYGLMVENTKGMALGYIDINYCLKCGRKLNDYKGDETNVKGI